MTMQERIKRYIKINSVIYISTTLSVCLPQHYKLFQSLNRQFLYVQTKLILFIIQKLAKFFYHQEQIRIINP